MGAGGTAETPKLYYVIYEQPLTEPKKVSNHPPKVSLCVLLT